MIYDDYEQDEEIKVNKKENFRIDDILEKVYQKALKEGRLSKSERERVERVLYQEDW